ncbi:MAG TPA: xanthine dehydrogenase family protein subunit M [Gemmatimonadaceae bacterium]|nr:xanthine dehydrogenase family protein subunit M [Gemmatimonadaceae bacterium]
MIPSRFDYVAPSSLDEAVALLGAHEGDAKVLSGGQSLIPLIKLRLAAPSLLVDINRIPGLAYVEERDGALHIGALAREADLERSAVVRERYPILLDTARVVADPIVRNSATVCGNLAHGDPGNDHPATMMALDAAVVARGRHGSRAIPVRELFVGLFTTALESDEIVTEIVIPAPPPRSGGAYRKLERKVGDYATAGVAAQVTLLEDGTCARAGIALTNVGATAIAATAAEAFLLHKPLDAETIAQAAQLAAQAADPVEDRRGTPDYKRDMIRVLAARALHAAERRARGSDAAAAAGRD